VTEMMTYDWCMITAYVLMCFLVILLHITNSSFSRFQSRLFLAPEIFIPDAYGTKNQR